MEVKPDIDDEVVILPSPQLEGPNAHIEEVIIIDSSEEEETKEKPKGIIYIWVLLFLARIILFYKFSIIFMSKTRPNLPVIQSLQSGK